MNKQMINDLEVAHLLSSSLSTWSLVELEIFVCVGFWREWKTRLPGEKTSQSKEENQQEVYSTHGVHAGIWTWATIWWGRITLTTDYLAPLGLGHKATKGSVEFTMSMFWITLMICSNFILTEGRWAVILSSNCPGCQEPEVETR